MNKNFFWIMTAVSFVLGAVWGFSLAPGSLWCLSQVTGVILFVIGVVANIFIQQYMKIDVPLGFDGTVYLLGVAVLGSLVTYWNPVGLGFALFLLFIAWISKQIQ